MPVSINSAFLTVDNILEGMFVFQKQALNQFQTTKEAALLFHALLV